jgi:hypothetical protein
MKRSLVMQATHLFAIGSSVITQPYIEALHRGLIISAASESANEIVIGTHDGNTLLTFRS